ncbi:hypothetical protein GCM10009624_09150 [Gordonia sinesedis]
MTEAVGDHEPPAVVRALAGRDAPLAVWRNEAGGTTYRLGAGPSARYLKWQPPHLEISLRREAERLEWARAFLAVPRVIDYGVDTHDTDDGGRPAEWLLTEGLPGRSAVAHPWRENPEIAVAAVGAGLRLLHETLPIESCPWTWRVTDRIADAAPGTSRCPRTYATRPRWTGSWCAMATRAVPTRSSPRTARAPDMWTSAASVWPTGGPTSPLPR